MSAQATRRDPRIAAVLAFVCPGVGYLYAGRGRIAILLLLLWNPVEMGSLLLAVAVPVPFVNIMIPTVLILGLRALLARGAARAAAGFGIDRPVPFFSRWYSCVSAYVVMVFLNLPVAYVYRTTFVDTYRIAAGSMENTILSGEYVLAVKWTYGWRVPLLANVLFGARQADRGDLAVFRFPEDRRRAWVKRVIGLPGETVEIRRKVVFIDGKRIEEPYTHFLEPPQDSDNWGPVLVPAESYFVLGDNRDNSRDSRFWGFVPQDDLLGRARVVYWSCEATRELYHKTGLYEWVKSTLSAFGRTRWERIGQRLE
jgi:signal peptidase I